MICFYKSKNLSTSDIAPLSCGDITGFKLLLTAGAKKGTKIGVNGIDGTGHKAIIFAGTLGAEVITIIRIHKIKD